MKQVSPVTNRALDKKITTLKTLTLLTCYLHIPFVNPSLLPHIHTSARITYCFN